MAVGVGSTVCDGRTVGDGDGRSVGVLPVFGIRAESSEASGRVAVINTTWDALRN